VSFPGIRPELFASVAAACEKFDSFALTGLTSAAARESELAVASTKAIFEIIANFNFMPFMDARLRLIDTHDDERLQ
jgi:hypothetical protein